MPTLTTLAATAERSVEHWESRCAQLVRISRQGPEAKADIAPHYSDACYSLEQARWRRSAIAAYGHADCPSCATTSHGINCHNCQEVERWL